MNDICGWIDARCSIETEFMVIACFPQLRRNQLVFNERSSRWRAASPPASRTEITRERRGLLLLQLSVGWVVSAALLWEEVGDEAHARVVVEVEFLVEAFVGF
jgi:hypothetical protein